MSLFVFVSLHFQCARHQPLDSTVTRHAHRTVSTAFATTTRHDVKHALTIGGVQGNCKGDKCNQDNGACASGCDDGYYSLTCTTPCMYSGCQACDNLGEFVSSVGRVYCARDDGVCSEGQCVPGYFRSTCTERCNGNCGINTLAIRSCYIDTGRCTEECEQTWFGPSCDISCPVNCVNQNCYRKGECRQGCMAGYWGPQVRADMRSNM
ncbi:platelet endothelial aggregation receptor 1-like [Dreissena polymorpha]|uniref:platelet endothelial aggregation receptor 1-like n=1 Tax=Dreissena polymorpha TaxID=45954 RepID=UPI002263FBE5|nr:platelet endothelial aggregation receptor 1-like [Dreissena polymorpha]